MRLLLALLVLPLGAAEVPFGAHATLRATGNGNPAPTFECFKDGVKVGSNANYVIPAATLADAGTYVFRAANGIGPGASSVPLVVVIAQAPVITSPFPNVEIRKKDNYTLAVTAYGPSLKYQWKKGGKIIAGQVLPTFTITQAKPPDAGTYECEVSNPWGSISPKAIVTIK